MTQARLKKARAVGGLLAIVTLLGLVVLDAAEQLTLTDRHLMILSALISALLGVDVGLNVVTLRGSKQNSGSKEGSDDES